MTGAIMLRFGRVFVILAIALLFMAYANFVPTVMPSEGVADYVKNHFVREIIFGMYLAGWSIWLTLKPLDGRRLTLLAITGSIVVLPFWFAALFGWSTGGLGEVWGDAIGPESAYALHGSQVTLFYVGIVLLVIGRRNSKTSD